MDIDIVKIDEKIRKEWHNINEEINKIEEDILTLSKIVESNTTPKSTIILSKSQIDKKKECIKKLSERLLIKDFYIMDYLCLLKKKKQNEPKKIQFMGKSKKDFGKSITNEYINILKKYNLEHFISDIKQVIQEEPIKETSTECKYCKSKKFVTNIEQNIEICTECGLQNVIEGKLLNYNELSRVHLGSKYIYERKNHFNDGINQYMGIQNVSIEPKIYKDLEEEFRKNGLLINDKNLSPNDKSRFKNITKANVRLFLRETGWTKHYDDYVLIYHKMTGKEIPVIPQDLKVKLLQDFEQVSNTYDILFKFNTQIERKSFINKHHILYHLLKRHKFDCKVEDFNMLKTNERLVVHEHLISDIFKHLGWNFSTLF